MFESAVSQWFFNSTGRSSAHPAVNPVALCHTLWKSETSDEVTLRIGLTKRRIVVQEFQGQSLNTDHDPCEAKPPEVRLSQGLVAVLIILSVD